MCRWKSRKSKVASMWLGGAYVAIQMPRNKPEEKRRRLIEIRRILGRVKLPVRSLDWVGDAKAARWSAQWMMLCGDPSLDFVTFNEALRISGLQHEHEP
jgi:hypothetical protein